MRRKDIFVMLDSNTRWSTKVFKQIFCGRKLGQGVSREVFVFEPDPRYVVKVDIGDGWDNVMEFNIWNDNYYKPVHQHLAPCLWLHPNGRILIQKRISFRKKDYPQKLPNVFSDLKYQNYGFIKNQFVCCDYSRAILFRNGRLRTVRWWNGHHDIATLKRK